MRGRLFGEWVCLVGCAGIAFDHWLSGAIVFILGMAFAAGEFDAKGEGAEK